ncbi:MAG: Histidinol-phosphate aminotransferase [Calditrichaeota bacterium]|nr:Histidinol-phosphate aminotransferase [Calditrichota bacterium]
MSTPPAPPHIESLTPYQPGRSIAEIREELGLEQIIKLASNENPLGCSPRAVEAMKQAAADSNRYPRAGLTLRRALAARHAVDLAEVIAASGSEGVLLAAMRAYLRAGDEVITAEGTFIGFYVIAGAMNLDLKTVPLTQDYTYDLDAILSAVSDRTRLIYIANPNNPTGTAFRDESWRRFLERLPEGVLVVMDEAYYEYACDLAADYPDSLATRHDQVLVLRTFSKAYGLAGARVGYGVAHPEIITNLLKVKLPFEPSVVSEAAGLGALEDHAFLTRTLTVNREGLQRLHTTLDRLRLAHTDSVANFTLVPFESERRAAEVSRQLLERGIIARPMIPFRLPDTVRITVGTPEELDMLEDALAELFG